MPSEPLERILHALEAHGRDARPSGRGWIARCPAHDDRHASLSAAEGNNGTSRSIATRDARRKRWLRPWGCAWPT